MLRGKQEIDQGVLFLLKASLVPLVHLLYPKSESDTVLKFINQELAVFCQNGQFIEDQIGNGAKKL